MPIESSSNMPDPIVYSRYPMWLNHKSLTPVIVYDETQEEEYKARGYTYPGSADPHAYLVAKVSDKLDDAIQAMNARVEEKIKTGLIDLQSKLEDIIQEEICCYVEENVEDPHEQPCFTRKSGLQPLTKIQEVLHSAGVKLATDAMDAVREIAKSTRHDG